MSKYDANTKVTFSVSTGYVGCRKQATHKAVEKLFKVVEYK